MKIAIAGTGYVGLSMATLLAQHNSVAAVDVVPQKVEMINRGQSPIKDDYIQEYLSAKALDIKATLDFLAWVVTSDEGTLMMAEQLPSSTNLMTFAFGRPSIPGP